MITPFDRPKKASATRKTAEDTTASLANQARKPEGVVLPWLMTMPLPSEGISVGTRPNEKKPTPTDYIGPESADPPVSTENGNSFPAPEELSERLACGVDERHLPRAAQLALVPGLRAMEDLARLPPVNQLEPRAILPVNAVANIDRFATGVYGPNPRELDLSPAGIKEGQRGIFLVATIFAASALCIWTIGWRPSSDSMYGAQVASSAANLGVLFPQPSSGQVSVLTPTQVIEKNSGQSGQFSQPVVSAQPPSSPEAESRSIAESSANVVQSVLKGTSSASGREQKTVSKELQSTAISENAVTSRSAESPHLGGSSEGQVLLAMPRASAAPPQTPSSKMASRRLEPEEIKLFITRGEQLMATGDIVAARIVLQRAAESDEATAAIALGAAYDPNVLARLGVVGISADLEKARTWYQKAESLGSPDARRRLGLLER
jgi:hypothetical protein